MVAVTGPEAHTTPGSAVAVGTGVAFAAAAAVAFGLLAPVTLLGMDLWSAHVTHITAPPTGGAVETVGAALLVFMIAVSAALVVSVPLGALLGYVNGVLVRTARGRSWPAAVGVAVLVGVPGGIGVPMLVVGGDVLAWLQVLTGLVSGAACGAHLRYLAGARRTTQPDGLPG